MNYISIVIVITEMKLQIELTPAYVDVDVECGDVMGGETSNVEDDSELETKKILLQGEKKKKTPKMKSCLTRTLITMKTAKSICKNSMLHDKKW